MMVLTTTGGQHSLCQHKLTQVGHPGCCFWGGGRLPLGFPVGSSAAHKCPVGKGLGRVAPLLHDGTDNTRGQPSSCLHRLLQV